MNMDFNLNFDDLALDGLDLDMFLDGDEQPATPFARVKRHFPPRCVKYEYAQALAKDIGPLEEGEHINAIVSGNFIAGDFLEAYLFENDLMAEEILIATLSMSRENVDSLKNIQDYRLIGKLGLIVSDFFFSHERKSGIEDIITQLSPGAFTLAVAGVHTKIALIKTTCGQHIVVGGSANLRSSLNVEQITIDNCPILYAFHREWMATILNNYQATHKMLRREPLWQMVQTAKAPAKPAKVSGRLNSAMPRSAAIN